ncbi:MAG: hypothetical protein IJH47_10675 [Oscillospiraceae bacterium]|nr:hypothetical protein [Oscillospiraceae bacterium]
MTTNQKRALAALIRSPTIEAAAQDAGVGYSTLRRWIKEDAEFQQAYQEELAGLVADAAAQAKQSLSPALSTLREILEDQTLPGAVRVSAARALLDYGLKLTEIADIIPRLEALENDARGSDWQ